MSWMFKPITQNEINKCQEISLFLQNRAVQLLSNQGLDQQGPGGLPVCKLAHTSVQTASHVHVPPIPLSLTFSSLSMCYAWAGACGRCLRRKGEP